MVINNPKRNIRLIDLLDMYAHNEPFNYDNLYEIIKNWLGTEKKYLVNETMFDDFCELLCDRFYERNLNFDTFLDCKLKIRNTLRKYREKAKRMFDASLIDINPMQTYEHDTEHTGNNTGNSSDKGENSGETHSTFNSVHDPSEHKTTVKNWDLHSDTPSDSIKLDNMIGANANYITDANNSQNVTSESGTLKDNSNNDSNFHNGDSREHKYLDDIYFHELQKGYDGIPSDLLNKYIELNLDVVNFYLDMIEHECIFSNILY